MYRRLLLIFILSFSQATLQAQSLDKVVAIVNDSVITESELTKQVEILINQIKSKNMAMPEYNVLKKQILQHLIDVELELQLAKRSDMNIDDADLDLAIKNIAQQNKLSIDDLKRALQQEGLTWSLYKDNIRKEMMISKIQQEAVGREVHISPKQVKDYMKNYIEDEKKQAIYHVQNLVIPLPEAPTSDMVKKAQNKAQSLFKKLQNGEDFSKLAIAESSDEYALEGGDLGERQYVELPEVFGEKILKMRPGQVSEPFRTPNGFQLIKLVSVRDDNEHHQVTKTHVRHILLHQDASMTAEAAEKEIRNLYQQLKSGKSFETMAKQYSLDPTSASKGGDLGWVVASELVPAFASAMDALPLHKISEPVKTPFGWHIIEVLDRKTEDDSSLYVEQRVRQLLQERKFKEAVQRWQQHVRTEAYIKIVDKDLA